MVSRNKKFQNHETWMVQFLSVKPPRMMMAGVEMERKVINQMPKSAINEQQ